jgi:hypothetical protein
MEKMRPWRLLVSFLTLLPSPSLRPPPLLPFLSFSPVRDETCSFRDTVVFQSKISTASHSLLKWLFQTLRLCSGTERSPQNPYISMLSPIRTAVLSNRPQHLLLYPLSVVCPSHISRTSFPFVSPPEPFFVVDEGYSRPFGQTILTFSL